MIFAPAVMKSAKWLSGIVYTGLIIYGTMAWCNYNHLKDVEAARKEATKITRQVATPIRAADQAASVEQIKIKTVYKTIYVEAERHEDSGNDALHLSSEWLRIFNEGARGLSNDTSPLALDDDSSGTVSGAEALKTIVIGQSQYHEISSRLNHCQAYVSALSPFYSD